MSNSKMVMEGFTIIYVLLAIMIIRILTLNIRYGKRKRTDDTTGESRDHKKD